MERRTTHKPSKRHELYLTLSPLTLCSCLIFVTSVTVAFDYVSFVRDVGREICPYTNFCHTNASKILDDDDIPCCLPCSCADDCWKLNGDCCPDKTLTDRHTPKVSCKAAVVKRKFGDTRDYNGYNHGVARYRVVDTCLGDEDNLTLVAECEGNKTKIEHFVWVSDKTGRIFDNRFCAFCNGLNVTEFVMWGIRTTCFSVLKSNYSSLSQTLLSDQCDFRLELPRTELHAVQNSRCFTPGVFQCNQTGVWDYHNSSIEMACETFDSPVLYLPPGRMGVSLESKTRIYKNIYCVACNEQTHLDLCPLLKLDGSRFGGNPMGILIDYKAHSAAPHQQAAEKWNEQCDTDEVYDGFKSRCLKLFCPFGSISYRGNCRRIALDLQGLTILINYNLKAKGVSNASQDALDTMGKTALGRAIAHNFMKQSGAEKKKCFSCSDRVMVGDNATEFLFSITFYTSSVCHLDTIFALGIDVLGKTLTIKYGEAQRFSLDVVGLEKRSAIDIQHTPGLKYIYNKIVGWCGPRYTLNKETICPEVRINSSEVTSVDNLNVACVIEEDSGQNNTISICWGDYILAMSKCHKSASHLFHQYQLLPMFSIFVILTLN